MQPLPMPTWLAVLRGALSASASAIPTVGISFAVLVVLLGVDVVQGWFGGPPWFESDAGDAAAWRLLTSSGIVSATALSAVALYWIVLGAAQTHVAWTSAARVRPSAADTAKLEISGAHRLSGMCTLLLVVAVFLGAVSVISAAVIYGFSPTSLLGLIGMAPAAALWCVRAVLRRFAIVAAHHRLEQMEQLWPAVASKPALLVDIPLAQLPAAHRIGLDGSHPALSASRCVAVLGAMSAALGIASTAPLHDVPFPMPLAGILGWAGAAVLLPLAVCIGAAGHLAVRERRAQFYRDHPRWDPWWDVTIPVESLDEIRGWLVGG
ncbi:hypothetical protein [Brachybacterium phenoliresistens]|uniref:hypothetical protein n=1 Tax=Brachybacterium phenoliresistens TaxID=396014 RepID=UPI0018DB924E|nr:hypothetical protein [Brachybacterium phenoliresistens]